MTEQERYLLSDSLDKLENKMVDLCIHNGVGWSPEDYNDTLIYMMRCLRLLTIEILKISERKGGSNVC